MLTMLLACLGDWPEDWDADGFTTADGDCDDLNPEVSPEKVEVCDGFDNNCDGETDEEVGSSWFEDADGDGSGNPDSKVTLCEPDEGWVESAGDCDDTDSSIHPGADEICSDGIDNNCDGTAGNDCELSGEVTADNAASWVVGSEGGYLGASALILPEPVVLLSSPGDVRVSDGGGAIFVLPGPLSAGESSAEFIPSGLEGELASGLGWSMAGGDFDGDGIQDALIAAPGQSLDGQLPNGAVYLLYGPISGAEGPIDEVADVVLTGARLDGELGHAVHNAGDLNEDTIDDVMIYSLGGGDGVVHLITGPLDAEVLVSEDTAAEITEVSEGGERLPTQAGLGDVDGDGFGDILLANENYVSGLGSSGGAWLLSGSDSPASGSVSPGGPEIIGEDGFPLGAALAAGDLDGDGYADVLLGEQGPDDGARNGIVYRWSGGVDMHNTDLELDAAVGEYISDQSGPFHRLSAAGCDLNGDGQRDLVLAESREGLGMAAVFYGPLADGSHSVTVADLRITGAAADDRFGHTLSCDEATGDAYDDLLIAAPEGERDQGVAYLFVGQGL